MDSLREKHTSKVSLPMRLLQCAILIMFKDKFKISSLCYEFLVEILNGDTYNSVNPSSH